MESLNVVGYRPVKLLPAKVLVESGVNNSLLLRSPEALQPYARCLGEWLEHWAMVRPDHIFLAQREGEEWRSLTYSEVLRNVRSISAALLQRNLSAHRPVAILSENSIEHSLLALAAMHIGVPVVPISASYSLMSRDFKKLRAVFSLMTPGMVFVDDGQRFESALAALSDFEFELVAVQNNSGITHSSTDFSQLMTSNDDEAVQQAFSAITPDTIAKFLLTSGSTGEPKAVITTHRMLCSNQQAHRQVWPFVIETPPIILDWLPWNHAMAGNNVFGTVLSNGGSYYIDEGRPLPGLIEKTVRNLREIGPTLYFNVPRGYDALISFLENDAALRRNFFSRLQVLSFGGAAMPSSLWQRLERVAEAELGQRIYINAGYGATETAPGLTLVHFETTHANALGLPIPGVTLKMVPLPGNNKYELRVKGDNVTPGYWRRTDLTELAFDHEGFYRMGDAARFVDANEPFQGIEFAGRVAEEFKLTSGIWVQVGALRTRAISALSPIAQDIVIAGHDQAEIGFLIFPNLAGCRSLCPQLPADANIATVLMDERVRQVVQQGLQTLRAEGGGSSTYATRAILLDEPPQIDAGEITDKGYLNQRAVLERRASLVAQLYNHPLTPAIITLDS